MAEYDALDAGTLAATRDSDSNIAIEFIVPSTFSNGVYNLRVGNIVGADGKVLSDIIVSNFMMIDTKNVLDRRDDVVLYPRAITYGGGEPYDVVSVFVSTSETSGYITVRVYDVQGRFITTIADHENTGDRMRYTWDGKVGGVPLPTGLYYVEVMKAGTRVLRTLYIGR